MLRIQNFYQDLSQNIEGVSKSLASFKILSILIQIKKSKMIQLKNIEKVYRTDTIETLALNNINLEVGKGEFLSIMGPSGCGKSTLLNIIGLLDEPSKGSISIGNQTITNFSDKTLSKFRNQKLGFIFQSYHLINDLPVLDNVELPLLYRNISASERKQLASEALAKVGLSNRMMHYPSQLSGGQRQRVAIARAIVGKPEIILADEPTGNLDSVMGNEVMEILENLNNTEGVTIVMVTHDENMAKRTHRLVRLFDGSQVA
jgi:putative ABC transport system ATP-binding protein